ncbi:hypothetical protein FHW66_001178 [Herbaspirillum sp. Sphag64]|nr:hypothetical protein [Herbaspirillum sp. Sphag64]
MSMQAIGFNKVSHHDLLQRTSKQVSGIALNEHKDDHEIRPHQEMTDAANPAQTLILMI